MTPTTLPISNTVFGPPSGLEESQVNSIPAFVGVVPTGPVEGLKFCVVAWKLSPEDLEKLKETGVIYLSVLSMLIPHFLTTDFQEATYGVVG